MVSNANKQGKAETGKETVAVFTEVSAVVAPLVLMALLVKDRRGKGEEEEGKTEDSEAPVDDESGNELLDDEDEEEEEDELLL